MQVAPVRGLGQDAAGVEKALEGLPPEVRRQVRLVPEPSPGTSATSDDPLDVAIRLALQISGDNETRDRHLHLCGRQALAQGRLATARDVAARIGDHRAGLLLLDLAEVEASQNPARARELLDLAASLPARLKAWQAESLLARLISTGSLLGCSEAVIEAWWQALRDPAARYVATATLLAQASAGSGTFDLAGLRAAGQDPTVLGRPVPGLHEVARRLFDQALDRLASSDPHQLAEGQKLLEAALEVLTLSRVAHAELLLETSVRFFEAGHQAQARQLFGRAEGRLGAPHEQQARLLCQFARLWRLRGRAGDLQPVLEQAEADARRMEVMHHPFAFAWLAAAHAEAGDDVRAKSLLDEAVHACRNNPNRRTALAGAVEICLCQARTGRPLPAGLLEGLAGGATAVN